MTTEKRHLEIFEIKYTFKDYLLRIIYAFAGKSYSNPTYWKDWNGGDGSTADEIFNGRIITASQVQD